MIPCKRINLKTLSIFTIGLILTFSSCKREMFKVEESEHDLVFDSLSARWDEGMPLGNAFVGALIWQKDSVLRMSLDRIDLWDLRPMENLNSDKFSFDWVYDLVMNDNYRPVQEAFDDPYNNKPAPSKIPGAALEFNMAGLGRVEDVRLFLNNALCRVRWEGGQTMKTFVHAQKPVGWFVVEDASDSFVPELIPPVYETTGQESDEPASSLSGHSLARLGYEQGKVTRKNNKIVYHQKGWNDFYYDVAVKWKREGSRLIGAWSVTSSLVNEKADKLVDKAMAEGPGDHYAEHLGWWNNYWAESDISIPDSLLEKQYYNEMYKFGSIARRNSYPISLQAVWTADNGEIPPWKGDYHYDLYVQMSYWPTYTGNHLDEGLGLINTLWRQRETHKKYTRDFYGTNGLNIPGVCTLTGEPMGGWVQYSFSPTIAAWAAQHFYLHWKYSADDRFLEERGYPYLKDVATHLEGITRIEDGKRTLPLSSSPEIYDNSIDAWFQEITNYDLALISFAFKAAAEMATSLELTGEAQHWTDLRSQLPDFDLDETGALTFAPGHPYEMSHRHFSHQMAYHPLGLVDMSHGERDRQIIQSTIDGLEEYGSDWWTGYSFSWLGNLYARAFKGEKAADALRLFAKCFCLKNTFHVNGDQCRAGHSNFTYRPFTLEGNFAFASGIQEMLLQSHTGVVRIFPAIPKDWAEVRFDLLRAQGAFLISADWREGKTVSVKIQSEKGGILRLKNPLGDRISGLEGLTHQIENGILTIQTKPGQTIELERK